MTTNNILFYSYISSLLIHHQKHLLWQKMETYVDTHSQTLWGGSNNMGSLHQTPPSKLRESHAREGRETFRATGPEEDKRKKAL